MGKNGRAAFLRIISLTGFFVFMAWMSYMHQAKGGGPSGYPSVDSLCPLGGLETLHRWLSEGDFLRRVAPSAIVLFTAVTVMTLLLGRVFCAWICPLGAIGEFCGFAGRKLRLPRVDLPERIDRYMKFLKYIALIGILWGTFTMGTLVWRDFDPWVAWSHAAAGWDGVAERPWAWVVFLGTVVGAGLFIERFWCRYLCPLGAALGVPGKFSTLRVGCSGTGCSDCGLCRKACPVQLHPEKCSVSGAECLVCGKCVTVAPEKCGVQFRFAGKSARVLTVGVAALLFFFGSYAAARALGYWRTNAPQQVTADMNPDRIADSAPGARNLDQTGASGVTPPNPSEIRGSATLLELKEIYGLEPSAILKEAGWPEDLSHDVTLRDLRTQSGRDVGEIREAVRRLLPSQR